MVEQSVPIRAPSARPVNRNASRVTGRFTVFLTLALASAAFAAETRELVIDTTSEPILTRGLGVVTQLDMDVYLARMPEHQRPVFLQSRGRIGEALNNLILPRQIVAEARERAPDLFNEPLLQGQLYQGAVVQIAERYMDRLWQQERLDDYTDQARELFLTSPERLPLPERVSFTHVLVQAGDSRSEAEAMRRILEVHEQAEAGTPLGKLAGSYSDDPSVTDNQGRFDDVELASLDKRVAEMLKTLKPGERSQPFRSRFGWHIVQLHDLSQPKPDSFEDVRERALELAESLHEQRFRESVLRRFHAQPTAVEPGSIEQLLARYPVDGLDLERVSEDVRQRMGIESP